MTVGLVGGSGSLRSVRCCRFSLSMTVTAVGLFLFRVIYASDFVSPAYYNTLSLSDFENSRVSRARNCIRSRVSRTESRFREETELRRFSSSYFGSTTF